MMCETSSSANAQEVFIINDRYLLLMSVIPTENCTTGPKVKLDVLRVASYSSPIE